MRGLRLLAKVKEWRREIQFYLKFGRKIKKIHKSGGFVYVCAENAVHGNMGDQALGYCRRIFLKRIGVPEQDIVEYTSRDRMRYWPQICKVHSEKDVIILRGGGFWGDLWLDGFEAILQYIAQFSANQIVVFPQSVYFGTTPASNNLLAKSQEILQRANRVCLFARDFHSFELLNRYYPFCKTFVTPDTVLSYKPRLEPKTNREGILLCLRNDKEKNPAMDRIRSDLTQILQRINDKIIYQDTSIDFNLQRLAERDKKLYELWRVFAGAKLVITDRLHGMIFAAITETPCIVFDNLDGKVGEQYKWIQDLPYVTFIKNGEDLLPAIHTLLQLEKCEYPVNEIIKQLDSLRDIFQKIGQGVL